MRPKRSFLLWATGLTAVTVAAALAAGCAGSERPVRLGVLTDCVGLLRGLEDQMLAGAELPFLARGAQLRSASPQDGVTEARLPGGQRVELVRGCSEGGEFTTVIEEARRLVEREHVDAVIGGVWPGDGIVLAQVARLYPDVPFVAATAGPQEVTLSRASPNVFRFRPSFGQSVGGLGSYAFAALGWRHAAVVAVDNEEGWGEAAAFSAEFCALGGQVLSTDTAANLELPRPVMQRIARGVDGVAVFSSAASPSASLLKTLATLVADPRSLALGLPSCPTPWR